MILIWLRATLIYILIPHYILKLIWSITMRSEEFYTDLIPFYIMMTSNILLSKTLENHTCALSRNALIGFGIKRHPGYTNHTRIPTVHFYFPAPAQRYSDPSDSL